MPARSGRILSFGQLVASKGHHTVLPQWQYTVTTCFAGEGPNRVTPNLRP